MADERRWESRPGSPGGDGLVQPPSFVGGDESEHLGTWDRLQASWHGLPPAQKLLAVAAPFLVVALGALAVWALPGGNGGDRAAGDGPVGASAGNGTGLTDAASGLPLPGLSPGAAGDASGPASGVPAPTQGSVPTSAALPSASPSPSTSAAPSSPVSSTGSPAPSTSTPAGTSTGTSAPATSSTGLPLPSLPLPTSSVPLPTLPLPTSSLPLP